MRPGSGEGGRASQGEGRPEDIKHKVTKTPQWVGAGAGGQNGVECLEPSEDRWEGDQGRYGEAHRRLCGGPGEKGEEEERRGGLYHMKLRRYPDGEVRKATRDVSQSSGDRLVMDTHQ